MRLVQPGLEQGNNRSHMHQSVPVSAHDISSVVHPGRAQLDEDSRQRSDDKLPFARDHKYDRRRYAQLRLEDERSNSQSRKQLPVVSQRQLSQRETQECETRGLSPGQQVEKPWEGNRRDQKRPTMMLKIRARPPHRIATECEDQSVRGKPRG